MTDNEIIKALECCKNGTMNDCDGCPCFCDEDINTARECAENLMSNALDLINRKDKEIWALHEENAVLEDKLIDYRKRNEELIIELNRLQAELKVCNEALDNSMKLNSHLQAENESLKIENAKLKGYKTTDWLIRGISPEQLEQEKIQAWKAEAYKEFAERLKEEFPKMLNRSESAFSYLVDNLLKELVGENDEM